MPLRQRVGLEYEQQDGSVQHVEVEYSAIDLRAWETAFDRSALLESMSVGMLTWLGHHAAVRQGLVDGALKEYQAFDEVCTSVEGVKTPTKPEAAKKAVATRRTASGGSSSP